MSLVLAVDVPEAVRSKLDAMLAAEAVSLSTGCDAPERFEYEAWANLARYGLPEGALMWADADTGLLACDSPQAFLSDMLLWFHEQAMSDGDFLLAADLLRLVADVEDNGEREGPRTE